MVRIGKRGQFFEFIIVILAIFLLVTAFITVVGIQRKIPKPDIVSQELLYLEEAMDSVDFYMTVAVKESVADRQKNISGLYSAAILPCGQKTIDKKQYVVIPSIACVDRLKSSYVRAVSDNINSYMKPIPLNTGIEVTYTPLPHFFRIFLVSKNVSDITYHKLVFIGRQPVKFFLLGKDVGSKRGSDWSVVTDEQNLEKAFLNHAEYRYSVFVQRDLQYEENVTGKAVKLFEVADKYESLGVTVRNSVGQLLNELIAVSPSTDTNALLSANKEELTTRVRAALSPLVVDLVEYKDRTVVVYLADGVAVSYVV